MKISETVGMISTGALLAIGVTYILDRGDAADAPVVVANAAPVVAAPETDVVTRADTDLISISGNTAAEKLNQIVALSQVPLVREQKLTPMQREVIAFFEDVAMKQNTQHKSGVGQGMYFNNMAVNKLSVQYYYTFNEPFAALDRPQLITGQERVVKANLCGSEAITTLMRDYGFRYTYNYQSADGRFAGQVKADINTCL
ncbi:MAG: hypothetical protein ACRBBV_07695 [Paracoccaceae bacterium]